MFGKIASFELRYQLRNPVFWVVAILFFLLAFGAMTVEQIQIGSGGNVHANSPEAIAQMMLILSLFFMFVTTAFVANIIVRDDESGFGPMVRSTRVSKFSYLIGRFTGAAVVCAIAFAAIPLAIWLGSMMPWLDSETLGPNRLSDYLYAYFLLGLPNVLFTAAVFFAVATMTRSMMYSYVSVVVFLVLYFVLMSIIRAKPELRELSGYIEPFGLAAFSNVTRYWTAAESNAMMPPFAGPLLGNRLIWGAIGLVALAIAYWRFSFSEKGVSARKLRKQARKAEKLAATPPQLVDTLPPARPEAAAWTQLWQRCRFEMGLVLRSPAFIVLLMIGLFNTVGGLLFADEMYGTPARPLTFVTIQNLLGMFGIIPIIIAIYYSGELVWRDRDRKMHEIIDATALPNWAYMVPKTLAVTGVLFATLLISAVAAIIIQLARGVTDIEIGQYLAWYLVPMTIDMAILAVLAVFVQAISPNKYVGWGIMVIYLVATITLSNIGFDHPLYNYGTTGTVRFSDMNGDQVGGATAWWLRLYWGAFALALAVLAHLIWRRGTETRLRPRLARGMRRLAGTPGLLMGAALIVAVVSGGWLYYNMNVLNDYRTRDGEDERLANYEKKYLKYETVRQPSLTDIRLNVDLHPSRQEMTTTGEYRFVNDTGAPLSDLHIRFPDRSSKLAKIAVPGATLAMEDKDFDYRIFRFPKPLAPGAVGTISFTVTRETRGLRASNLDTRLVGNGTFLNNFEIAPAIGMDRQGLLSDRVKRRKYGLPPELRQAKLEDLSAQRRNYVGNASWVRSDITISTDAGQTPIAPGRKVADTTNGDRRTARFVSEAPILAFFSIQSADYAENSLDADGVRLTIFYDRKHPFNVDRMLAALKSSLGYYQANFGPYQFDHARIIEFPGYQSFAQAFAGTMPYSESLGFLANNSDADKIDYVTYVTAHELAHQYWAHQVISADMQGGTIWVETMAQYSALMVMKQLYGEDNIRRFLKYELDSYLRNRGSKAIEELPLERVENQGYIHYRKGSLVMYLLQDRLGEDRVNAMLRQKIAEHRFKGAPYPRSTELVDGFRSLARNAEERQLVDDLLTRITLYDLKAKTAKTRKLADGRWETTLTVEAAKAYADGKGKESTAPLADRIDIGLFDQNPGYGVLKKADVISMTREPVRSGAQRIRIVSTRQPAFAGIDPYNKYVDRNGDDNVIPVTSS
ncbi:aminopeptidase [Nostoc sp. 3335mG]|nr:aminopeptidase [Nostoc sp. 3335mG]